MIISQANMRLPRWRKEQIVLCFVLTTRGRIPTHLGELLRAMRSRMGPVTEDELRRSIKWSLQQSRRSAALFARRLREERRRLAGCGVVFLDAHVP